MPVTSSAAVTLLKVCLILSAVAASVFCGCGRTQADHAEMTVLGTEDRGTYECLTIEMTVADGDRVKAYLLVPDHGPGDRLPAVLMLHDHGARFDIGKEKLACPPSDEPLRVRNSSAQWADKYFGGAYMADSLAAGGYVVLVADALYWGDRCSRDALAWSEMTFGRSPSVSGNEREADGPGNARNPDARLFKAAAFEGQRHLYDSLARNGRIWAEKILDDDKACASFLASLPYVDRDRVGAFGFSMGAHRCWLLAAFSDDIKFGAAVCWMTTKSAYDSDNASDLSMRIPSLRDTMDFPDISRLTRPKPMLFINGEDDHLFPKEAVYEAFGRMQSEYAGCPPGTLRTYFVPGGHHCGRAVQDSVISFFSGL